MSTVKGNYVCTLYYFPVTNDNESNTLLQNVEISPFQHDDSLHSTTRKSSHPKRTLECYPSLDFETKRNRYVSSIGESVTELMQTFKDETLSVNNAKRQKLQVTAPSTEPKYDLSTPLNFPYKDFIKKNQGDNIQLWHDEEEQSRLEKHFNTKWQVEFFSKFYSGELLETPDIFGPKATKKVSKNDANVCDENHVQKDNTFTANFEQQFAHDKDEKALFMPIVSNALEDHSDVDSSSSAACPTSTSDTSYCSLQEAAVKLFAAMDDTDKTRDAIVRIEQHLNINRDEVLKGK